MKIFAVGMNYIQHNKELDGALYKPEKPVIFTKADSSLLKDGKPFFVPDWSAQVDYEAELVVRICRLGKGIPVRFAHRYYDAMTVGIDFTARDMQREARSKGLPWDICKGFDGAAVIGEWKPTQQHDPQPTPQPTPARLCRFALQRTPPEGRGLDTERANAEGVRFHLDINGRTVQQGCSDEMLYSIDELISYISQFYTLKTGDLLYTGTPVGVGPVHVGDHLEGYLENDKVLDFYCR